MATAVRVRAPHARRWFPEDWPISFLLIGYPVLWVLGFATLIWPVVGLVLAVKLSFQRNLRVPKGFGIWMLFLVVMAASGLVLHHDHFPFAYVLRFFGYLSVTVCFIWVYNADESSFSTQRAVKLLSGFWILTVVGGWLGVLLPNGQITSVAERLLPASVMTQPAVSDLVHPAFAQVQYFLGYPVGRPKAPFVYTNDWGAVYALLAPWFFYSWLQARDAARRHKGLLILAVSLVPVFISLNRGLWLGLGAALLNAATRSGDVARAARRVLAAMLTLGLLILVFTPLSSVVTQSAENGHSNEGRSYLYTEAVNAANHSPLIGHGSTIKVVSTRKLPDIGTQGQFWTALVAQGWLGALLFTGFLARMWWATRRGPTVTFWAHATVTVALVVMFVYDFMPVELHLIFIVIALGLRESQRPDLVPQHAEPELAAA